MSPGSALGAEDPGRPAPRVPVGWALVIGLAAAVLGLLPWLVTGLRLPVQNLWAGDAAARMPVVLLPFSQYAVTIIMGLFVVGAACAGLYARAAQGRRAAVVSPR